MNYLLLMMGGSGTRLGADVPKQYIEIDGVPIFMYILSAHANHSLIDGIVVVSNEIWIPYVNEWVEKTCMEKVLAVVGGGKTRSESVRNGLEAIKRQAQEDDIVLIHDATHPYIDKEGIVDVIEGVKHYGGATLGACQYDTCYQINEDKTISKVIPRTELVSGASPEGFRFGDIYNIYSGASTEELDSMTSAGAIALAHGIPMVVVPAKVTNLKITYPDDLELFKLLIHSYFFR